MNYLPYIDGLRAIAILLVLFFHADIAFFPSGFIGVDIFFVISGFLITGIIYTSLDKEKFSFARFYSRRLWRLQPVFICLLVATSIAALIYCLPDDLVQYSKSLRKTSLYLSNVFFSNSTIGYFAPDGKQLPLLHTWSLSIEWQCYLILPLLLFLLHRWVAKKRQATVVYLVTGLAFALALYCSFNHAAYSYYLFSSRIFEFFIGSCVALNRSRLAFNHYWANVITLLALSSLLYISTLNGVATGFPNFYAFIVCVATALLILAGTNKGNSSIFVIKLLSTDALVGIGLLSYSLYIWHWPIFAFSRYLGFEENSIMLFLMFAATFLVAYGSWRFIEKPARHFSSLSLFSTLTVLLVVPILLVHLGAYEIKKQEGFPLRFSNVTDAFSETKRYHSKLRESCLVSTETALHPDCIIGVKNNSAHTALMIGDSFSNHYWRFIEQFAREAKLSIAAQATVSCLTLPGINQRDFLLKKGLYKTCQKQTNHYYELIKNNHYNYVLIAANWNGYLQELLTHHNKTLSVPLARKQIGQALDRAVEIIVKAGSKPVLIKAIPLNPKVNSNLCFLKHLKQRTIYKPEDCDYKVVQPEWLESLFADLEKKYPELIVLDPQPLLCPNGLCKVAINQVPVFRDAAHLTDYASYFLGKMYLERYKNPFIV
ncbi:acyltransferase family protein [Legionella sp. km772]|uniref:acyltransferase family protein n=1 Tax=Legionella sp. km772 TaxID=2498111 RepID=UPI000F8CBCC2|nr:acyltransferase family protein [Legionella sp. km772]RUR11938.1 acyltransferase [Legionella sp. km772]